MHNPVNNIVYIKILMRWHCKTTAVPFCIHFIFAFDRKKFTEPRRAHLNQLGWHHKRHSSSMAVALNGAMLW